MAAPKSFRFVLAKELEEIGKSRQWRLNRDPSLAKDAASPGTADEPALKPDTAIQDAHSARLVGLALSGGGIRSATFNLGVIQALAELKLLRWFDYLSCVSGGGYIAGWLCACLKRYEAGQKNYPKRSIFDKFTEFERKLAEDRLRRKGALSQEHDPDQRVDPIWYLRQYSNYLTPRLGILGPDTWTLFAVYVRNLVLNLGILITLMAAVLLIPLILAWIVTGLKSLKGSQHILQAAVVMTCCFLALAGWGIGRILSEFRTHKDSAVPKSRGKSIAPEGGIITAILATAASVVITLWFGSSIPEQQLALLAGLLTALFLAYAATESRVIDCLPDTGDNRTLNALVLVVPSILASSVFAGAAIWLLAWLSRHHTIGFAITAGFAMMVTAFSLTTTIHIGLLGKVLPDERREWWNRLDAHLFIYTVAWLCISSISVYGPSLVLMWARSSGREIAIAFWLAVTVAGVVAGKHRTTGGLAANHWLDWIARIAPWVFIAGLFFIIAVGLHTVLHVDPDHLGEGNTPEILLWLAGFCTVGLLFAWRVDINEFSMHHFYRNRLIRCYLGASRWRHPHPFIGFDPDDDLPLAHFTSSSDGKDPYIGPYPIFNTALNLVRGQQLAWQQRKAASFMFSPHFCGFEMLLEPNEYTPDPPGARGSRGPSELEPEEPSPIQMGPPQAAMAMAMGVGGAGVSAAPAVVPKVSVAVVPQPQVPSYPGYHETGSYTAPVGVMLGTAMAISGAAASPNMGFHSSPAAAFLMTMFNVRLGWWLGNPAENTAANAGPSFALFYLLRELLGLTDHTSKYVYLSDGGHFENLGIYELVRRRCRFIVASDAGQDRGGAFEDLANAIRKCRTDMGIEIEIDVDALRDEGTEDRSPWHCVVGTIHYEIADKHALPGTLFYLKSSLTGDESVDIKNYSNQDTDFPHQPTAKQWFTESQFESYRQLGYHVGKNAFRTCAAGGGSDVNIESGLLALRERWVPRSRMRSAGTIASRERLSALMQQLREDPKLDFLDSQLYSEWPGLQLAGPRDGSAALPVDHERLRRGFYLCVSQIELMERLFGELDLEQNYSEIDNRGWMNLFRRWAASSMLRMTWAVSASGFSPQFQTFCRQRLNLDVLSQIEVTTTSMELKGPEGIWIKHFSKFGGVGTPANYRLSLVVPDPSNGPEARFDIGIAIVIDRNLVLFRIRDYLRRSGVARTALKHLVDEKRIGFDSGPLLQIRKKLKDSAQSSRLTAEMRREMLELSSDESITYLYQLYDSILNELNLK
jgi:hypothetical protein